MPTGLRPSETPCEMVLNQEGPCSTKCCGLTCVGHRWTLAYAVSVDAHLALRSG
jgi:hypothetical protein